MQKLKRQVFYEVDPRFFKDYSGNGIGDLKGLANKIDYFDFLEVEGIILQNILSLNKEDKIQSFTNVSSTIGEINDLNKIISLAHAKNIQVFIELPIGKISEKHDWFLESQDENEIFEDVINVSNKKDEIQTTSNLKYKYSKKTKTYYLQDERTKEIPLNWKNENVFRQFNKVIRFWNNLKVDGFVFKDFENIANEKNENNFMSEETLKELRKLYREVKEIDNQILIIGKTSKIEIPLSWEYTNGSSKVFDFIFNSKISLIGTNHKYGIDKKGFFSTWELGFKIKKYVKDYSTLLGFGSNLTGRVNSRWGNDGQYWSESAKCLALIELVNPSSNIIHHGDELGSLNIGLNHLDDFKDKTLKARKNFFIKKGGNVKKFMDAQILQNPINSKSIMAWNKNKNGGFSVADKTIIPASNSYERINVETQYFLKNSPLNFYKKLINLVQESSISNIIKNGKMKISFWNLGLIKISIIRNKREILAYINLSTKTKRIWKGPKFGKVILSTIDNKEYQELPKILTPYEGILISKQTNHAFQETQYIKLKSSKERKLEKEVLKREGKELEKEATREIKIQRKDETQLIKQKKNEQFIWEKEKAKKDKLKAKKLVEQKKIIEEKTREQENKKLAEQKKLAENKAKAEKEKANKIAQQKKIDEQKATKIFREEQKNQEKTQKIAKQEKKIEEKIREQEATKIIIKKQSNQEKTQTQKIKKVVEAKKQIVKKEIDQEKETKKLVKSQKTNKIKDENQILAIDNDKTKELDFMDLKKIEENILARDSQEQTNNLEKIGDKMKEKTDLEKLKENIKNEKQVVKKINEIIDEDNEQTKLREKDIASTTQINPDEFENLEELFDDIEEKEKEKKHK